MIRKILIKLSGEPKNNEIIEKVKLLKLIPLILIAIVIGILAVAFNSYIMIPFAVAFSWQAGWAMSIERFKKSEKDKSNDTKMIMLDTKEDSRFK